MSRTSPRSPRATTPSSSSGRGARLRAAQVIPIAGSPIADGSVAIRGGQIVGVGPADQISREWRHLPERDLGDAILLPGFVDAHSHLEWSLTGGLVEAGGFAGWLGSLLTLSPRMGIDDHHAAAAVGALRCLQHGTTTVADSGPTGAGAAALREAGLRGIVHLEAFGRHTGGAARDAAIAIAKRVVALDDHSCARVQIGVSPHAPYTVGPDFWEALVNHPDLAHRSWATHLAESPDESELIGSGTGPLARLFTARGTEPGRWPGQGSPVARLDRAGVLRPGLIAAHCVQLDPDDPARLAAAGVGVAHCPLSNATLACGHAPIVRLRDAGVTLGLGTDSPASAGDYDLRADGRAAGMIASLTPAEIVELATLGGATTLGLDRLVGSIEIGKRADLIAITGVPDDPDPYAAALDPTARVSLVLVDGIVLLEDGEPVTLDPSAILTRATASRRRLTAG